MGQSMPFTCRNLKNKNRTCPENLEPPLPIIMERGPMRGVHSVPVRSLFPVEPLIIPGEKPCLPEENLAE